MGVNNFGLDCIKHEGEKNSPSNIQGDVTVTLNLSFCRKLESGAEVQHF